MSETAKEWLAQRVYFEGWKRYEHKVKHMEYAVSLDNALKYGDMRADEERERLNLVIEHIREQIAGLYDTGGICFECKKRDTKECDEKGVCGLIFRLFDNDAIDQANGALKYE